MSIRTNQQVELSGVYESGIHGESRSNLLKRLKNQAEPFDGDIVYSTTVENNQVVLLANGHDIGLLPSDLATSIKNEWAKVSLGSTPIITERYGNGDKVDYAATVDMVITYPSEHERAKSENSIKWIERGEKFDKAGKSLKSAGDSMQKTGKSVTSFVLTLILLAIIFFLYKSCSG